MEKFKILFVCLGNICRSPGAEAVFAKMIKDEGLEQYVEVDSAGISAYHEGGPSDARMQKHSLKRGYHLTSISRQVDGEIDFDRFDMIIGMDDENINDLKRLAPTQKHLDKIFKMTDFCNDCNYNEVPDPYYGGEAGFELVLDLLEDASAGLLEEVKTKLEA